MPTTLATLTNIAKEIYEGTIRNQLQDEAVGWKRIIQTSDGVTNEVGGKYVTFPIRVRRNAGIGFRQEQEALPSAGQQGYASVRIPLKYGYGRVRLSGQLFELMESNYQSFASAMDSEMTGLKNDISKDTNRMFYGNATGALGVVTAFAATPTVTVANSQYFNLGDFVDLVATGSTLGSTTYRTVGVYVSGINTSTNTITLSTSPTSQVNPTMTGTVANDFLVRSGSAFREPNGLGSIVTATGALYNVDPSVEPSWAAIVDGNSGTPRPISENLMIKDTDAVRRNGGKTSLILMSLGVRRAYFNLLTQQRRYPSTQTFAGGLEGLEFHNGRSIPCVEDLDCPPSTMYGLQEDSFKIYASKDWSWMDRDGNAWKQVVDTTSASGPGNVGRFDAYEAINHKYYEVGIERRNANWVMQDIQEA